MANLINAFTGTALTLHVLLQKEWVKYMPLKLFIKAQDYLTH